ncbi:MAG: hypothetical protein COZ69_08175 [Deltaproteobacteria bacterium CG_4_8_14_3_um_filter_45_9]|nr:MAG: hypothetical protein COZ69_08175 [Deltaproteobacteria bacterium CG_4_8_14_3_um_filter_45_9]
MLPTHLGMENFFLPVAIEEAAIPVFTERISSEVKEKALHCVPFQDLCCPRVAAVKKPPLIFFH